MNKHPTLSQSIDLANYLIFFGHNFLMNGLIWIIFGMLVNRSR